MVQRLKKNYDHTFKHLLKTRWLVGGLYKSWVAENPEIGSSPTGHIMRVRLLLGVVRIDTPAGRASQEEGISPLQRHKERRRRKG